MSAVLVIEDEAILGRNLRTYLQRQGYEVRLSRNGEDALSRLAGFAPSVVLVDYRLPGIDGLEVLRRVRKDLPTAKVIMMTGQGSEKLAVDAMKAGAFDYLPKPVVLDTLGGLLKQALKAPAEG